MPRFLGMPRKGLFWAFAAVGVVATFAAVSLLRGVDNARERATRSGLQRASAALESFYSDQHRYPTTAEGLGHLRDTGYLSDATLRDAWGNPLHYELPGTLCSHTYDLFSFGADETPGGTGSDADISNCAQ